MVKITRMKKTTLRQAAMKLAIVAIALFAPLGLRAQETLTVYNGTETNGLVPFFGYFMDTPGTTSEFIIPADQLGDMVGGTITKLTFYISGTPDSWGSPTVQIYLGEVEGTTLSSTNGPTNFTVVYTGIVSNQTNPMVIEFDDPYDYEGGNLLIGTYVQEEDSYSTTTFYGVSATSGSSINFNSYVGTPEPQSFLPKTTFEYEPAVDFPKPRNLQVNNVTGHEATLTWETPNNATLTGYFYRYKKTTDANFNQPIDNGTSLSVTLNSLDPETEYQFGVYAKYANGASDYKEISFTTATVVDADNPFFEGFEGTTFPPNCWSVGEPGSWTSSTYTGPACAYSGYYGPIYLYTPILHIDGTAATLSFSSYNTFPESYGNNNGKSSVLVSVNGGDWTELWSPESVSQSWVVTTIDMTDYVGQTIKLCFKYEGNNAHGWYIDYVNLYVPTVIEKAIEANKWYAISSPVHNSGNDETLEGTNLTTGTHDLFGYTEATGYWDKPTVLEQGQGYIYRRANDVTLSFVGFANSGDISHDLSYACTNDNDLKGFNLVGNPYPLPATCGMPCYRLTTTGTWHAELESYNVPVCEAVLVKTNGTGNHVSFTTSSAKSATNAPSLAFTVSNDEYEDVAYAILDGQGDAQNSSLPKIGHLEPNAPALSIPVGGKNYAIATLGSNSKSFDMAFSGIGNYTISIDANANVNYLHLIDKLTGSDIDLLLNNSYSFRAGIGDIASRFVVKLVPGGDNGNAGNFAFWNGTGWTVEGEGPLYVFDALGRKILSMDVDTQTTINKSQLPSTGVYILRLGEKTQKIVVK